MKSKEIYKIEKRVDGYFYSLVIKETQKSYIIEEFRNAIHSYNKILRYHKFDKITTDISNLQHNKMPLWLFCDYYINDRYNVSYWSKWEKVK